MTFADDLKARIKDSDVEGHLTKLVDEAEKFVSAAAVKAGGVAHDKREDVESFLDKATARINEKTKGQYADKVAGLRETILRNVDKLADKRPGADAPDHPTTPSHLATPPVAAAPADPTPSTPNPSTPAPGSPTPGSPFPGTPAPGTPAPSNPAERGEPQP